MVPFTIDEYRKTDGIGRRQYMRSVFRQRKQVAENEANKSFEKMKQLCVAHGVVCEPFSVGRYAKVKKRIDAGELLCVGAVLYNAHEGCEKCRRIQKHAADWQGYRNAERKWAKRLGVCRLPQGARR
jgi:hypothetical protein